MRLIDADLLKEQMESVCMGIMAGTDSYNAPLKTIDNAPTIDAVPVVHGHWEEIEIIDDDSDSGVNDEAARCSVCEGVQGSYYWATNYFNYCPNCGAKMDGEVREEGKNE